MIGGKMDISTKFLRISRFVIFTAVVACGHSKEELTYLKEIQGKFPDYSFSLTDSVTGLELTMDIKTNSIDSVKLIQVFKEVRKPIKNYSTVSWVYLIVTNGRDQLTVVRENSGGEIVFLKERDQ